MADVSKIFKPRRGTKSIMAGSKASTVLASGEMFVEVPDAGVGKGASKIKIGDGTTAYSSLPYALGDTSNDQITFSSNTSTTVAAALNSVTSGGSLKNIVAGLKQAISLCNTSITQLNDEFTDSDVGQLRNDLDELNDSLGGFEFKLENGKKQVSTDGGNTWENFSNGEVMKGTFTFPSVNSKITLTLEKEFSLFTAYGSATNSHCIIIIGKDANLHIVEGGGGFISATYTENTVTIVNGGTSAMAGKTITYAYA